MFNLQGSEIIFILLIALVVLGPEKLPGAIRRAMRTYQELRKMGDGFQSEFRKVVDEPLREMKETAGLIQDQANPKKVAEEAERQAHTAAKKDAQRKKVVDDMHAAGAAANEELADAEAEQAARRDMEASNQPPDEWGDPVDPPQHPSVEWGQPAGVPAPSLAPPAGGAPAAADGLPADPTTTVDDESAA